MSAAERRKILLEQMDLLEQQGIDCRSCMGTCCTSRCNTMLITELEAQDIKEYLLEQKLWSDQIRSELLRCIQEFRLDVETPQHGQRRNLRRTYTCPFYSAGPKGCWLPREIKPYGCLGFNPTQSGAQGLESGCRSDQKLLLQQEQQLTKFTSSKESAQLSPSTQGATPTQSSNTSCVAPIIKLPIPMAVLAAFK